MLDDAVREVLRQPLVARVTTINPDGYPHTVPIWFILDGDDIVLATGGTTRKVRNILANPKGAVTVGGDPKDDVGEAYYPGYLLQGDFSVERDPSGEWIKRITYHYRKDKEKADQDIAEWGPQDAIRLKIRKVIRVM
jgi:nitroimidazol reductase NimA-like FMN-containing flavoprotein (pyridoxamine 5'-phosphate oxidase superfamily)